MFLNTLFDTLSRSYRLSVNHRNTWPLEVTPISVSLNDRFVRQVCRSYKLLAPLLYKRKSVYFDDWKSDRG